MLKRKNMELDDDALAYDELGCNGLQSISWLLAHFANTNRFYDKHHDYLANSRLIYRNYKYWHVEDGD